MEEAEIVGSHGENKSATEWRGRQIETTPYCGVPAGRKRKGDDTLLARLGANLSRERRFRGVSQESLAEAADLHPRVVQKIEAGETNLKATTLFRIQAALGCPWESIVPRV